MADNTTLYIIIGVALLLAFMNANSQQSATGGPAMSAYLRRRATMPPAFIGHVPTESGNPYEQPKMYINVHQKNQYIQHKDTMPQYLRGNLSSTKIERFSQGLGGALKQQNP